MEMVEGLRILKMKVRESFTHEEGISTPRARHKGQQPLIECANHDFKVCVFSLILVGLGQSKMIFILLGSVETP